MLVFTRTPNDNQVKKRRENFQRCMRDPSDESRIFEYSEQFKLDEC